MGDGNWFYPVLSKMIDEIEVDSPIIKSLTLRPEVSKSESSFTQERCKINQIITNETCHYKSAVFTRKALTEELPIR
jgi:hypothetical protein